MKGIDKKEWTRISLGEACSNINETVKKPEEEGIERYIGLEHIEPGNLRISTWGNVSDGTTFTKRFTAGQVLFGKRRAYQKKAALADFDGICSGDILVLEANEKIIDKNLFPFLISSDRFFEYAVKTSAGSLSPRTKFQDLARFEFLLPPREEQAKLAELLWGADDVVCGYGTLARRLRIQKSITINDKVNNFNQDTEWKKIISIADVIGGYAFKSSNFSNNPSQGTQVLKIANLTSYGLDLEKVPSYIEDNGYDPKYLLIKNDIAISLTGSNGKRDYGFAVINDSSQVYWVNQRVAIIRAKNGIVLPKYIYYLMKEGIFLDPFFINATGTANQANVSTKDLESIKLPIPKMEIQAECVALIESIEATEKEVEFVKFSTAKIKKQLVSEVFSV